MKILQKFNLKLLWLFPIAALAAAPFLPDYINTTNSATQPVGYVGAPAANGYILDGNQSVFTINYSSKDWTGDLNNYPISSAGAISSTDNWLGGAAAKINAQNEDSAGNWIPTGRKIVTMNGSSGVAFTWANLSTAQKIALDSTTAANTSATSSPVLNYIRGDSSNDTSNGGTYRVRNGVLGDIIHTTPIYWNDGTDETVYVGANDGMLHAIDATADSTGGSERFAYIPSVLIPKLSALKSPTYTHKYFVDGQLAKETFDTQTILAGGLGGGAMGLFALDISAVPTSEADAASKVLWEITNQTTGFSNLGHTYGTPVFATLPDDTKALIVANGYNNGCNNACDNGVDSPGNGHSSLFIINAVTGAKISEIDAGTGTTSSPNGLSSPTLLDVDGDQKMDYAYAGDIDGNLWKFDLDTKTKTKLFTTNPVLPITMAPTLMKHPNGGYMVMFATGKNFNTTDNTDTSTNYAYGIWDRPSAYSDNADLLEQTLTESNYTYTPTTPAGASEVAVRVRTITNNIPNWDGAVTGEATGTLHHMGWKVALPLGGERVIGDGGFLSKASTFTFLSTNPTINPTATVPGENWDNRLDALTGGRTDTVNFDLNADGSRNTSDQVTVSPSTTLESPASHFIGGGIRSPLAAFQSASGKDIYQANYDKNGIPAAQPIATVSGVAGGHFDTDNFYGSYTGTAATATITVDTSGQSSGYPATLGAITVNDTTIVPALTVTDVPNGTASSNIATLLRNKINATGNYKATASGNVVTITAPILGTTFNNKAITIADGTSQTLVAAQAAVPAVTAVAAQAEVIGVKATGFITFSGTSGTSTSSPSRINNDLSGSKSIAISSPSPFTSSSTIAIGTSKTATQAAAAVVSAIGTGGAYKAYVGGDSITPLCAAKPNNVVCIVDNSSTTNSLNNNKTISIGSIRSAGTLVATTTKTAGGVTAVAAVAAVTGSPYIPAVPQSGWTNLKPALTATTFTGALDGTNTGSNCTNCSYKVHVHQYDDKYDVTGVNYLNASNGAYNLANVISPSTQFKVIMHNQYLNPAVKLHIGNSGYKYNVDTGYVSVKNYTTSSTLDLASLPNYTLANIGSLAANMPVDALSSKDWWGNGDVRSGLIPTLPQCVWSSATSSNDGNMFQPVIPPTNGIDGPGTKGWSGSTTPASATGARHGGALTLQVIRADTTNSQIEQNVPGRPEYGWRVKSQYYASQVLTEHILYWHHPNNKCFGDSGWTKTPGTDEGSSTLSAKAAGSTDPHIGNFGLPVAGTVTTVETNADGTTTTTVVVTTINANGSATITTTITNSGGGGSTTTTVTDGITTGGGVDLNGKLDENGLEGDAAALGRVNWRELFK